MAIEIERKWLSSPAWIAALIAESPEALDAGTEMRQGYLAVDADVTTRLRITAQRAVLTIKAGTGLARTEVEVTIPAADAEQLWPHTAGRQVDKRRHRVAVGGRWVAEVDVYHGALDGLVTVEVEFPDTEAAAAFVAPAWFGVDVTGDSRWSNASLALLGRPDAILPP